MCRVIDTTNPSPEPNSLQLQITSTIKGLGVRSYPWRGVILRGRDVLEHCRTLMPYLNAAP